MIGRYCRVEPLDPQRHGAELHQAYTQASDDADWTYLSTGPWPEPEPFMEWLDSVKESVDPIFFAIVDVATGLCTGLASYLRIDPGAGVIEVGHIHLSRALQQTPAATEAMYLMMQRVFELGYRRYEWKCDDLNAPSRAAAARLGFSYEGTFRQATRYKGRNRDTSWFSILDREWPALDAEYRRWLDPDNFDEAGQQRTSLGCRR
ncbi:UNVERIFIED_CONTAM: hypothetical protein GTU68_027793 [Idotea baltica]|nr:hypothetical protein [Idotea baltica]